MARATSCRSSIFSSPSADPDPDCANIKLRVTSGFDLRKEELRSANIDTHSTEQISERRRRTLIGRVKEALEIKMEMADAIIKECLMLMMTWLTLSNCQTSLGLS